MPHILPRDRITSVLENAVNSHSLVVLTAPMGYGKTTAAQELMGVLQHRVFYVHVTPGLHNALYMWDMTFGQLATQGSDIAQSLRDQGFPTDPMRLQRIFEIGHNYLAARPTLLVLDDYHYVTDPAMDLLLEALVREAVPNFCILLLSRSRPNMQLEDLRLKGLAALFDQNLLRFSKEETMAYFALHDTVDIESASSAWEYSEGWAAALWLSLQRYRTHGTVNPTLDLESLLAETVYAAYTPEEQAFLLQLSILDSFTVRQVASICNDREAPRRLRALYRQNAFLNYDPATEQYQLHSIFRSFLEARLAELPPVHGEAVPVVCPEQIYRPALYRRAGEWFASHDDPLRAIRFFFRAGRDEDLLRILEIFAVPRDGLFVMFDPEGVLVILSAIPWRVRCLCPVGWLAFTYHYMSRCNLEKGLSMLEEAAARFAAEPSLSATEKRKIAGEIELIHGIDAFNDLFAMRDRYAKAYELLQGRSAISHPHLIWTFGSPHAAFQYLREPGSYTKLVTLVEENLYQYQEITGGCSAGAQDLFRAEFQLETGEMRTVEERLMKAAYKAMGKDQLASLIAVKFTLGRLCLAQRREAEFDAILDELREQTDQIANPLMRNSLDLCLGYLLSVRGTLDGIPPWLYGSVATSRRSFYQGAGFIFVARGKALLATQDWPRLEAFVEEVPAQFGIYKNLFGRIHTKVLQSIAVLQLRGIDKALLPMQKAVELARTDKIILTIGEYGTHILPLLQRMREFAPGDRFIGSLRKSAKTYATWYSGLSEQEQLLAPQERAVMAWATKELSCSEIAKELGLAPKTVRNTLSRIYAKLGVNTRTQAIRKWQEEDS